MAGSVKCNVAQPAALRALYRAVHASPRGQKAARQKALVMGVAKMLAEESGK